MTVEQFEGCLLGLALGDALGAPYEGRLPERLLWRVIGTSSDGRMRWTDDTQMALDLAESLVAKGELDLDYLAMRLGSSYRWSRGYGPGTAQVLKRIARGLHWREGSRSVHGEGSFGNGGAVRAAAVGLFYFDRLEDLMLTARLSASVTHAHPLGMEGAALVASATAAALGSRQPCTILQGAMSACRDRPFVTRLQTAMRWLESGDVPTVADITRQLGFGTAASESCVTGVYLAARFVDRSFCEMQEFIAAATGDVDTVSALAGAVWGAANGVAHLPQAQLLRLEQRERLSAVAAALYERTREAGNRRVSESLRPSL